MTHTGASKRNPAFFVTICTKTVYAYLANLVIARKARTEGYTSHLGVYLNPKGLLSCSSVDYSKQNGWVASFGPSLDN
ncbi:protein of unknown function (plasmid) [Cupriavidus taiwanensis]|uniref:Uncharacterized protein n=1 Tax=Cupriavidus taiwanensis TaxID=164546 RepID=A0A375EH04_9BURK|nr:protein of unknown function [Cupriavidus taiwanensis]SOZ72470.1 protein of unknown function [Cupriavidus taiwanensis]SOZ74891.1 protein of unknown function [Cupriavidus taiwanensis]SPA03671.1 protein of unknown function [Cupriavidus taiwanensis]SPA11568.1 protein of unknown function [Cupriavidus taiwanensis]